MEFPSRGLPVAGVLAWGEPVRADQRGLVVGGRRWLRIRDHGFACGGAPAGGACAKAVARADVAVPMFEAGPGASVVGVAQVEHGPVVAEWLAAAGARVAGLVRGEQAHAEAPVRLAVAPGDGFGEFPAGGHAHSVSVTVVTASATLRVAERPGRCLRTGFHRPDPAAGSRRSEVKVQLSPRQVTNQLGAGLTIVGTASDSRSDAAIAHDAEVERLQSQARQDPKYNGADALARLRRGQGGGAQ